LKTEDDTLANYCEALGDNFGRKLRLLELHLFQLRSCWRVYDGLFGLNEERFKLIHSASNLVAGVLELTLYEHLHVQIRRLIHPSKRKGVRAVVLKDFFSFAKAHDDRELKEHLTYADAQTKFAVEWVSKKIAHNDPTLIEKSVTLPASSRAGVVDAIDACAKVIEHIHSKYLDTTLITHPVVGAHDETRFMQVLFEGVKKLEEKEEMSRKLSRSGDYESQNSIYVYPEWLKSNHETVFDIE